MNRTIVHTLAYNLPSEVDKATRRLKYQNRGSEYEHYIVDLSFPLNVGNVIPPNIRVRQSMNSIDLMTICESIPESEYLKFKNIGVSQNWTNVIRQLQVKPIDVIIGADPDEVTKDNGWVDAMAKVLRSDQKIALCSLMMVDLEPNFKEKFGANIEEKVIDGIRVYIVNGLLSWALIGLSGAFLSSIGNEIPFPPRASRYGWIEGMLQPLIVQHGYKWCILPDYRVEHTNNVPLYREWKDRIVYKVHEGQPSFEDFLVAKCNGIAI